MMTVIQMIYDRSIQVIRLVVREYDKMPGLKKGARRHNGSVSGTHRDGTTNVCVDHYYRSSVVQTFRDQTNFDRGACLFSPT
jgi:hypothetical protein